MGLTPWDSIRSSSAGHSIDTQYYVGGGGEILTFAIR